MFTMRRVRIPVLQRLVEQLIPERCCIVPWDMDRREFWSAVLWELDIVGDTDIKRFRSSRFGRFIHERRRTVISEDVLFQEEKDTSVFVGREIRLVREGRGVGGEGC